VPERSPNTRRERLRKIAVTTATFSAPGDYVLRVQANDRSGD
jgi:hypothetical protein